MARELIFFCYAREDLAWLQKIDKALKAYLPPEKHASICWYDKRNIEAGEWEKQIHKAIKGACIAVCLSSNPFHGSNFIRKKELPAILEAGRSGLLEIMPVVISRCKALQWSPIAVYQFVNEPEAPLSSKNVDTVEMLDAIAHRIANTWQAKVGIKILQPIRYEAGKSWGSENRGHDEVEEINENGEGKHLRVEGRGRGRGTSRQEKLGLLRELFAGLPPADQWKSLPDELAESLAKRVNGRVCGGRKCKTCVQRCMLPLLGIPRLKEVIQHIFERKDEIVLLYGSQLFGKTVSSEGLQADLARGGHGVRVLSTTPLDLRRAAEPILQTSAKDPQWAQMEGVDIALLVMLACFVRKAVLQLLNDRTYCDETVSERFGEAKFNAYDLKCYVDEMYQVLPHAKNVKIDTLVYFETLMTSLIRILILLGMHQPDIHLILHLDDAHRLETEYAKLPGSMPEEDLGAVFAQWRKPSTHGGAMLRRRMAPKPREDVNLLITTRQLLSIVVGTAAEASHVIDVGSVNQIQQNDIVRFFDHCSSLAPPLASSDITEISSRIYNATRGYPWFVHRYLRAFVSLVTNTKGLSLSRIADIIENAQFIWFCDTPFAEYHVLVAELQSEIRATEENECYMADRPSQFAEYALLDTKAQQAWSDVRHCLSGTSDADLADDEAIKNIKDESLAKSILPLVQAGLISGKTTANSSLVAVNRIVKNVFIPSASMRLSHAE